MKALLRGCAVGLILCVRASAQDDGGVSYVGRGQELLESIYVPNLTHAPFSLTLSTEWTRPLIAGGTVTATNSRPIKRDSEGRIYMERWLLTPKGTNIKSRLSWIQIEDPVAGLYYECNPHSRVCEVSPSQPAPPMPPPPSATKSGPVQGGRGYRQHEDLGEEMVAGVPVHAYRDTVTLQAGTMGNTEPMTYLREMRYSSQLGFNLVSIVQSPALGEQRFMATEVSTAEPEPKWFRPPEGYSVMQRKRSAD